MTSAHRALPVADHAVKLQVTFCVRGVISPVLCNWTLDGLEALLAQRFRRRKVNFVRYADDFIVTGDSESLLRDEVQPVIAAFLAERGLVLSEHKTRIVHIDHGFDFLGQNVRKHNGTLLITPSRDAVRRVLAKVKDVLQRERTASAATVIELLNPIIRGWAYFHRHACSKRTFNYVDWQIWQKVWHWAKRRHPEKSATWVRQRYFAPHPQRRWWFSGVNQGGQMLQLMDAASVPIMRHIKVQGHANPYDCRYDEYFARRQRRGRGAIRAGGL